MLNRTHTGLALGLVVGLTNLARADLLTFLDEEHQGKGNKGQVFRPVDVLGDDAFFLLSARSSIDETDPFNPDAWGQIGTVYVDRDGTGVQAFDARGSKGISGRGGHRDEELIFSFDAPIPVSSITLELIDIQFGEDDPVLFISAAGSGEYGFTVLESEIESAFTPSNGHQGLVAFGMLGSLPPGLSVDAFKIRETDGHIEVSGVTNAIPEPAFAVLIGLGILALFRRRRFSPSWPVVSQHRGS